MMILKDVLVFFFPVLGICLAMNLGIDVVIKPLVKLFAKKSYTAIMRIFTFGISILVMMHMASVMEKTWEWCYTWGMFVVCGPTFLYDINFWPMLKGFAREGKKSVTRRIRGRKHD